MTLACTQTLNLCGLQAQRVRVEADLSGGLPQFNLIGMPAHAAREARDRVRVAIQNLGFGFPAGRVTVQLTAQDELESPALADLAISAALLIAMGRLPAGVTEHVALLGQLSISGALLPLDHELAWIQAARSVSDQLMTPVLRTALPAGMAAHQHWTLRSLEDLVNVGLGRVTPTLASELAPGVPPLTQAEEAALDPSVWDEIHGQPLAKRAAVVALAGGHNLLMLGPPGVGKSMIAHRLPALLPPLASEDAQQLAAIEALHRSSVEVRDHALRPPAAPFRAPHHTASAAALFGGGRPFRPGEISLAHGGVLFLDELAEFRRDALEALREPLETGWVQPARLQSRFVMPARAQLIAAMNPCPCGLFGVVRLHSTPCRCTLRQVQAYRGKLSAPLLDRFDLIVLMQSGGLADPPASVESDCRPFLESLDWRGAHAREAIARTRAIARARQNGLNAHLGEADLHRLPTQPGVMALMRELAQSAGWSRRVIGRVLRTARTIADLQGLEAVDEVCLAQAVNFRRGLQIEEGRAA
jgi:magnesium chelatase family protein